MKQGTKKFKLRGYNEDEYFIVYIYDRIEDMRNAANKFTPDQKHDDDVLAIVQPYTRIIINPDGTEKIKDNIGIIRFAKDKLYTHIVAHELVHAAMHHYRLTQSDRMANFGDGNGEPEEDFGMIYAKYFSKMSRQLYKHGLWK